MHELAELAAYGTFIALAGAIAIAVWDSYRGAAARGTGAVKVRRRSSR